MAFTFFLCVVSASNQSAGKFFKHPLTLILGLVLLIICMCVIIESKERRTTVPYNYFWLAGATLGECTFLAATAADLTVFSVYMAILATCISVAGLFVAALYTASSVDRDVLIRNMVKGMIVSFVINLAAVIFILFFLNPKDKAAVFGISCVMCLVSSAYIMFALLFIIIPGFEDQDDYILGALRLYLEIARLFYWLMKILGKKKK